MDGEWNADLWVPNLNGPDSNGDDFHVRRKKQDVNYLKLKKSIKRTTRHIREFPFDPLGWHKRASCLNDLGYPELAIGDLLKALTIYDTLSMFFANNMKLDVYNDYLTEADMDEAKKWLKKEIDSVYKQLPQGYGDNINADVATYIPEFRRTVKNDLVVALARIRACRDFLRIWETHGTPVANKIGPFIQEISDELQEAENNPATPPEEAWEMFENGLVGYQIYPWQKKEHQSRSQETMDRMNEHLQSVGGAKCQIRQMPPGHLAGELGLFATQAVSKGEIVMKEYTEAWGSAVDPSNHCQACCQNLDEDKSVRLVTKHLCHDVQPRSFCNDLCMERWAQSVHRNGCYLSAYKSIQDLAVAHVPESGSLAFLHLFARVLTIIKQEDDCQDALLSSAIAPLQTRVKGKWNRIGVQNDYVMPAVILRTLEIDPFRDHRFDTWVLRAASGRLRVAMEDLSAWEGGREKVPFLAVQPALQMANHSCRRNVVKTRGRGARVALVATRPIKEGEEVVLSYAGEPARFEAMGWQARSLVLRRRGILQDVGECWCTRCVSER